MRRLLQLLLCALCLLASRPLLCAAEDDSAAAATAASAATAATAAGAKATAAKSRDKNWNKMNFNDIEKAWEEGDAEDELEHDFERIRKIQEKKRPKIDMSDGANIRDAYNQDPFLFSSGGMMVFVDLTPKQPSGAAWDKKAVDFVTKRFASMLRAGGIVTTIYNIEETRLLINLDKTWYTKEMLSFLAKQPEVEAFTANSKTHKAKEYLKSLGDSDDDDEDL